MQGRLEHVGFVGASLFSCFMDWRLTSDGASVQYLNI